MLTFNHRIRNIPCKVHVTCFHQQPPDSRADNPDDYYGYCDIEYPILDRRGKPAEWLARKMDDHDKEELELHIKGLML